MTQITKVEGGYLAHATPPHVSSEWKTGKAQSVEAILVELRTRGVHQTDIGDAFYSADPNWLK